MITHRLRHVTRLLAGGLNLLVVLALLWHSAALAAPGQRERGGRGPVRLSGSRRPAAHCLR
jgi:hypothetical protein